MRRFQCSGLLPAGRVIILAVWSISGSQAGDRVARLPALLPVPAISDQGAAHTPEQPPAPLMLGQSQGFAAPLLRSVQPRQPSQSLLTAPPAPPAELDSDPATPESTVAPAAPFDIERLDSGVDLVPLRETSLRLATEFELPQNHAAGVFRGAIDQRGQYGWVSPRLSAHTAYVQYRPLYFEEVNLERYGYNFGCLQPFVSAARFYGTLPILPYKICDSSPCSYDINLEFAPAATAAPPVPLCRKPFNCKAAVFQSAVMTGAFLLIP